MAQRILAGAHLTRPPGEKYAATLRFAELAFPSTLPTQPKLAKWRASMPDGFQSAIVVPDAITPTARDEEAWRWLVMAIAELDASVVLKTGASFRPSKKNRELLTQLIEQIPRRSGRALCWSPAGLWDEESAYPLATELDVCCGLDPTRDPIHVPPSGIIYARILGAGAQKRVADGALYEVADAILEASGRQRAFVTIESKRSFEEASRLQAMIAEEES